MCIAIYKSEQNFISEQTLRNCFATNSDGAGFAVWSQKYGFVVEKGFMNYQDFIEAYRPYSGENKDDLTKAIIHFRIATHGKVNAKNTHPFVVNLPDGYKIALIHNGIISKLGDDKEKSDTRLFVERILAPLAMSHKYVWKEPAFVELVKNYVGWSKFVILDSEGNHAIINEQNGHWEDGVWFSNYSYDGYGYGYSYYGGGGAWDLDGYGYHGETLIPQSRSVVTTDDRDTIATSVGLIKLPDGSYASRDTDLAKNYLAELRAQAEADVVDISKEYPSFDDRDFDDDAYAAYLKAQDDVKNLTDSYQSPSTMTEIPLPERSKSQADGFSPELVDGVDSVFEN